MAEAPLRGGASWLRRPKLRAKSGPMRPASSADVRPVHTLDLNCLSVDVDDAHGQTIVNGDPPRTGTGELLVARIPDVDPGGLSLRFNPQQRQPAEAIRRDLCWGEGLCWDQAAFLMAG